ncbi:hypothetical protein [uncultured Lacinutrix sp.]|uniref:hypothetical protein n=1 Tax=uncultured Lacinutrix sp. TaxID=574032 RepID=UPI00260D7AA0|nr:hypothetical protein [uncultured Lacinutrix sp.]
MEIHLKITGILLICLALIHIFFPKYFKWNKELKSLSLINKQMMTTHTFFIALTIFLMGLFCLTSSNEIINTKLGNTIALGLGVFWVFRLLFQLFIYSPSLWKGKKFETIIHIIFSIFWVYFSYTFLIIFFNK